MDGTKRTPVVLHLPHRRPGDLLGEVLVRPQRVVQRRVLARRLDAVRVDVARGFVVGERGLSRRVSCCGAELVRRGGRRGRQRGSHCARWRRVFSGGGVEEDVGEWEESVVCSVVSNERVKLRQDRMQPLASFAFQPLTFEFESIRQLLSIAREF